MWLGEFAVRRRQKDEGVTPGTPNDTKLSHQRK